MAENEDLEVVGSVASTRLSGADEKTDEGADDEVEERQHRPIVPGLSERESGFPTLTGCGCRACRGRFRAMGGRGGSQSTRALTCTWPKRSSAADRVSHAYLGESAGYRAADRESAKSNP